MSLEPKKSRLQALLERAIEPASSVQDIATRRQVQFLSASSLILVLVGLVGFLISFGMFLVEHNKYNGPILVAFAILGVVSLIAYWFNRRNNPLVGSIILTAGISIVGYWLVGNGQPIYGALFSTIPLAFILGSVLLPLWGMLLLVGLNTIASLTIILQAPNTGLRDVLTTGGILAAIGIFILVTVVFRNSVENLRLKEIIDINRNLGELRDTLERRVEDRTRQVKTSAEISQKIASAISIEELLTRTVDLIVKDFGYYHAGIFLLDETGRNAELRAASSPAAKQMLEARHQLAVGSPSIIGWVTANKEPRLASNVAEDPIHLKNELLPETQAELGLPIIAGDQILGVLDVQSTNVNAFDNDTIVLLQGLAGQIASAIMNVRSIEAAQVNLQGVGDVYQTSYQIAQSKTDQEVFEAAQRVFQRTPNYTILMIVENDLLHIVASSDPTQEKGLAGLPERLSISANELLVKLGKKILVEQVDKLSAVYHAGFRQDISSLTELQDVKLPILQPELLGLLERVGFYYAGIIPIIRYEKLVALLVVGTMNNQPLLPESIGPYVGASELVTSALERIRNEQDVEHRLGELEAITDTSQAISSAKDLQTLYSMLHDRIRRYMGDKNFMVALYDPSSDTVNIPYYYERGAEDGRAISLEPFPLGEGLTSVVVRSKQPLMIVENADQTTAASGAKVAGSSAKSWLGAPLMIAGEVIGAIIVQDNDQENAFDVGDLRFLTTLTTQVAGSIYNNRLLDDTRKSATHLQTAAEIAREISGSLDINELLSNAVLLIRDRFNFYFSAVYLIEPSGEYLAIRESTGEAGVQMKRAGHKVKVGSKSVLGYVASNGEPFIVNDTANDPNYYPNPLLPDTNAEAAVPLKVGARILGVLDVHNTQAYSFSQEDVNVLRVLADQLAVGVINSELFAETQEHLSQHRLLHHVTTAAASGTTIEEALNSATQGLQVTLGGDRVAILLANKEKKLLEINSVAGYSEDVKQVVIPFGSGITGWVATHMQPQRIDDVTQDQRYIQVGSNVRSELAIPLVYRGDLLGVLNVESDKVGAYSENDEELLGTLAGTLAAIISNARLLDQIRHQVDRERLLYEVTSKIRRSTDMQTIMATTTSELSKVLGAKRAEIKIDVGDRSKNDATRT
jgi:GAF domain-containing protein